MNALILFAAVASGAFPGAEWIGDEGNESPAFARSFAAEGVAKATLSVTGCTDRLTSGHIRFLRENGAAGLSDSQLRAMRYNGELRVRLDGAGWLESYIPGLTVLFR